MARAKYWANRRGGLVTPNNAFYGSAIREGSEKKCSKCSKKPKFVVHWLFHDWSDDIHYKIYVCKNHIGRYEEETSKLCIIYRLRKATSSDDSQRIS